jgi:hypothetical protein
MPEQILRSLRAAREEVPRMRLEDERTGPEEMEVQNTPPEGEMMSQERILKPTGYQYREWLNEQKKADAEEEER